MHLLSVGLSNTFTLMAGTLRKTVGTGWRCLSTEATDMTAKAILEANNAFENRDFKGSARILKTLIKTYPEAKKRSDIRFLLAKSIVEQHQIGRFMGTGKSFLFGSFNPPRILPSHEEEETDSGLSMNSFSDLDLDIYRSFKEERCAVSTEVEDPLHHFYKGVCYYITGEWTKAARVFESVQKQIPEAIVKAGHAHLLLGNSKEASRCYSSALIGNPLYRDALLGRACLHLEKFEFNPACRILDDVIGSQNSQEVANNLLGWWVYRFPQVYCTAERGLKPYMEFQEYKNFLEVIDRLDRSADIGERKSAEADLLFAQSLLDKVADVCKPELRPLFNAEILTKIIAFLDLKEGVQVTIKQNSEPVIYSVSYLPLLDGIKATILTPEKSGYPPILIFRGTSLSLSSGGAFVSLWNNFDPRGVARKFFDDCKGTIETWLSKQGRQGVQVMGYSQGGALTAMTVAYFHGSINTEFPSISLHPPASDRETATHWEGISIKDRPPLLQYIVRGDIVSRLGVTWIGQVNQIEFNKLISGLNPHFVLTFAQPEWKCFHVDPKKDSLVISRLALTILTASDPGRNIFHAFSEGSLGALLKIVNAATSGSLGSVDAHTLGKALVPIAEVGKKSLVVLVNRLGGLLFKQ